MDRKRSFRIVMMIANSFGKKSLKQNNILELFRLTSNCLPRYHAERVDDVLFLIYSNDFRLFGGISLLLTKDDCSFFELL